MNKNPKPHTITLSERKVLTVNGVSEVLRFDEDAVVLSVTCGELNIGGSGLSVTGLSLETGEISVSGNIEALYYTVPKEKKTLLSRIFG